MTMEEQVKSCDNCGWGDKSLNCSCNERCDTAIQWKPKETPQEKLNESKIKETVEEIKNIYIKDVVSGKSAIIHFCNGKFGKCNLNGLKEIHALDDWKFLKMIADRIIELAGLEISELKGEEK